MSIQDMRLLLFLGLKGEREFTTGIKRIQDGTTQATGRMAKSWSKVDRQLVGVRSSLGKIAALVGGGALLGRAIQDVAEFERGLAEMQITAELTAKEAAKIREQFIKLAKPTLQLPEDQLAAFQRLVAAGLDPREAIKGMAAMDKAATASFSDVQDIAGTSIDLIQKMEIKPEKLDRAFNMMAMGAKRGQFELKNMAQEFPAVTSAASKFGITGEKGTAQLVAMLEVAREGRATGAEAATDMKAFFSHMISYRKQFQKVGFNVLDYIDLKSGKFKKGKDIDVFFQDMRKKTKGGSAAMLQAIGIQDYESSNFMSGLMKNWDKYKRIRDDVYGSAGKPVLDEDFKTVENTTWAKYKLMEIEKSKAMKSAGSSWLAETVGKLGNWGIENPLAAGGLTLSGYAGWKWVKNRMGDDFLKKGGGAPASKALGDFSAFRTPDYGMGPRAGAGTGNAVAEAGLLARLGPVSMALIPAAVVAAMAYLSRETGMSMARNQASYMSNEGLLELRQRHMVLGGGPKSFQVRTIDEELARRGIKNNINIRIHVDSQGRVITNTDNMNTKINTMKRGNFFDEDVGIKTSK